MVEKFKDAANILKAKIKKDELQESLVQATSEQNWQTPTNLLHEIANAAYNYQKCQQIIQFIWDKLKRKNTWRKIMKALNLVQFLIKNGPPSLVNTYKSDVYQFKSFSDYSHISSDGIDRGQAIRDRSKAIVQLLTNSQILQQQRTKAKTIRQRMSGMTSGYSGQSKYQGYDNKNYGNYGNNNINSNKNTNSNKNYGKSTLNTAYGDYTYNESTLAKYKDKQQKKDKNIKPKPNIIPNLQSNKPDITQQQTQTKKPFEKDVPKLVKPGQKSRKIVQNNSNNNRVGSQGQNKNQQTTKGGNLMDDDIFGFSQTNTTVLNNKPNTTNQAEQQTQPTLINPMYGTTVPLATQNIQTSNPQQTFINPMYTTTAPLANQNIAQSQQQFNYMNMNPTYGATSPTPQQQPNFNNFNFVNPMYGTTAPMVAQQQAAQYNVMNPMYNTPTIPQTNPYQQAQQQNWSYTQQPQPHLNPYPNQNQGITLSTPTNNTFNYQPDTSISNPPKKIETNWLTDNEKGLIDFSDFGTQIKKQSTNNNNNNKNTNKINVGFQW